MVELQRLRQTDLWEFKAILVYRVSPRTTKATKRNHVSKNQKPNQNKQKIQSQKKGSLWRHFFLSTVPLSPGKFTGAQGQQTLTSEVFCRGLGRWLSG